jgi:hypothetical protein
MKINLHSRAQNQGGVLLLTVIIFVVGALTIATYFFLTQDQYTVVGRAQTWNNALTKAEAGVEDALALLNKNAGSFGQAGTWSSTAVSVDNWDTSTDANFTNWPYNGGTIYHMRRSPTTGSSNYYDVFINSAVSGFSGPTIYSVGVAYWSSSRATFQLTNASRKVLVKTSNDGLLKGSLVAIIYINFSGNNVLIDSFNSLDPLHSNWQTNWVFMGTNYGVYPYTNAMAVNPDGTTKRKANGNVATDGLVIDVGNADIYGYVDTAPGGTAYVGANGSVGDVAWVSAGTPGIQPGYAHDDMNYTFPDVVLPTASWFNIGTGNGKNIVTIDAPGYYRLPAQQTASIFINTTNVVVYAPYGVKFSAGSTIQVNTNSSLQLYLGDMLETGSGTYNNLTQFSLNNAIYGLPPGFNGVDTVNGCRSIKLGGNGAGTGYVYAPQADLELNGGGSQTYDLVGAYVARNIKVNGHFNFHYDEALGMLGPSKGFIPIVWQEIY